MILFKNNQPTNQPPNQTTNQPTNQPNNQPTNQQTKLRNVTETANKSEWLYFIMKSHQNKSIVQTLKNHDSRNGIQNV